MFQFWVVVAHIVDFAYNQVQSGFYFLNNVFAKIALLLLMNHQNSIPVPLQNDIEIFTFLRNITRTFRTELDEVGLVLAGTSLPTFLWHEALHASETGCLILKIISSDTLQL